MLADEEVWCGAELGLVAAESDDGWDMQTVCVYRRDVTPVCLCVTDWQYTEGAEEGRASPS